MKQARNVEDLASRLTAAATAPLQVLAQTDAQPSEPAKAAVSAPISKAKAPKVKAETIGINLRPKRTLYERYVALAADRSRSKGHMVSAQQIMLEVLEKARV